MIIYLTEGKNIAGFRVILTSQNYTCYMQYITFTLYKNLVYHYKMQLDLQFY